MKQIKTLSEYIAEELEDAEEYIKEAIFYKDTDKLLAEMYYNLSKAEVEHANMEHEQAVRLIKSYAENPPASMQAVWDWQHKQHIEKTADIKRLQAMYKE